MVARIAAAVALAITLLLPSAHGDDPPPPAPITEPEEVEREVDRLIHLDLGDRRVLEQAQDLVALRERTHGTDSVVHALALRRLARALGAARRFAEAPPVFERALHILERVQPTDVLALAQAQVDYGVCLRGTPRWPEGRALVDAGLDALERELPARDERVLTAYVGGRSGR
jgi:hypothetical protein